MVRVAPLLLVMSLLLSAGAAPVSLRPGDPALDGNDYLISDADFRAIVSAARDCLKQKVPWCTARRVHVTSATTVDVHLGPVTEYGEQGLLYVRRTKVGWKVVKCGFPELHIF